MQNKLFTIIFPILISVLILSGCKPKPKVTVVAKRVVIKRISLKNVVLGIRYLIKNPHSVSITVKKVDQNLKMEQKMVATGKLDKEVSISAHSSERLDVNIVIPLTKNLVPVGKLILGKKISYTLTSKMELKTVLGKEQRTFLRSGELKLPVAIGGGLVAIKNPAIKNGNLTLDLIVKIPRPKIQLMATKKADYRFSIEKTVITKGEIVLKSGKGDFQEVKIPVSWPLTKGAKWGAKLLLGQSLDTFFRLHFDLGDETDFLIENNEKFNLNKLSPTNILKKVLP